MRFNPRIIYYIGPYDPEEEDHKWRTGGIAGLTISQWASILNIANESVHRSENKLIKKLFCWFNEGPKSFDNSQPGLYRGRGDEVTVLLENATDLSQFLTLASLSLYDILRNSGDPMLLEPDAAKRVMTPEQYNVKILINAVEEITKAKRERYDDYMFKPVMSLSSCEIDKRWEKHDSKKTIEHKTRELLKSMIARRNGKEYESIPAPKRVRPPRVVYEPHPSRPSGSTYDLPGCAVKIGDKLRKSFVRSPEFAYYRRSHLRKLISNYREWSIKNGGGKIRNGHKTQILRTMSVIDNCYEIEVAGLTPTSLLGPFGVTNQCYIGGGSGFSGLTYHVILLFRAVEMDGSKANQVFTILSKGPSIRQIERYIMDQNN